MNYILLMSTILQVYISTNGVQSQATVIVSLQTSTKVIKQPFELRCTYSGASCCTLARIWNRDGVAIMTNGNPISTRYLEVVNGSAKYFSLIITSLEESDLGKAYSCQYDFPTSASLTPTFDSTYIYLPTETECPMELVNRNMTGKLTVAKSAPSPTVSASLGGTDLTSSLTITGPTVFNTWFYTVTISINTEINLCDLCYRKQQFKLSVATSTRTTNFCVNKDFCKSIHDESAKMLYAWMILGKAVLAFVTLIVVFILTTPTVKPLQEQSFCSEPDGHRVILKFTVHSYLPVTKIYWRRNTDIITSATNEKNGSCTTITSLSIVTRLDVTGTYTCFATNCLGTGSLAAIIVEELVEEPPTQPVTPKGLKEQKKFYQGDTRIQLKYQESGEQAFTYFQKILVVVVIFVVSAVLDIAIAILVGYYTCFYIDCEPRWFILVGAGTCFVIYVIVLCIMRNYFVAEKVIRKKGSTIILICPYLSRTTKVQWQRVTLCTHLDISNGGRVSIVGNHTAGEYNLQLSDLQESDQVFYRCIVGKHTKVYKLALSDKNQEDAEQMEELDSGRGSKSDNGKSYEPVPKDSPDDQNEKNNK